MAYRLERKRQVTTPESNPGTALPEVLSSLVRLPTGSASRPSMPSGRIAQIQQMLMCEPASPTASRGNPLRELEGRVGPTQPRVWGEKRAREVGGYGISLGDFQYLLDLPCDHWKMDVTPPCVLALFVCCFQAITPRRDVSTALIGYTSPRFLLRTRSVRRCARDKAGESVRPPQREIGSAP